MYSSFNVNMYDHKVLVQTNNEDEDQAEELFEINESLLKSLFV